MGMQILNEDFNRDTRIYATAYICITLCALVARVYMCEYRVYMRVYGNTARV